ncbi:hypothetical protein FE782_31230 [Paenibacillus antri]|uniref:peptidylprolyl isomerase n=1 Tax=Paenibacillus antri TaxID=2582848 RepID=A0A5R9G014_9BACL|nr:hypothetical protein [Paenibacillus antri]TLS48339.1 hypothetical protein FE782_31230 [Paenibacillus antri]
MFGRKSNRSMICAATMLVAATAVAATAIAVAVSGDGRLAPADLPPAVAVEIDGVPVYADEFRAVLADVRLEVMAEFHRLYGADVHDPRFWTIAYGGDAPGQGERPGRIAAERTIRELVRMHAVRREAAELGVPVVPDAEAGRLSERLANANRERQEKLGRGEPVFGTVRFDETTFRRYETDRLALDAVAALAESEAANDERRLLAYYDRIKAEGFALPASLDVRTIEAPYALEPSPGRSTEEDAFREIARLSASISGRDDFERLWMELAERSDRDGGRVEKAAYAFRPATRKSDAERHPKLVEIAEALDVGRPSEPFHDEGRYRYAIALVTDRADNGAQPYDDVRDLVARLYAESLFEERVEERVRRSEVAVREEVVERLAGE